MVGDAEAHAAEDAKFRELAEIRNRADGLVPSVGGQVHVAWPAANGIVFPGVGT